MLTVVRLVAVVILTQDVLKSYSHSLPQAVTIEK